jgi:hypothetical protein
MLFLIDSAKEPLQKIKMKAQNMVTPSAKRGANESFSELQSKTCRF